MSCQMQNMGSQVRSGRYGRMCVRYFSRPVSERPSGAFGQVRRLHATSMEGFVRWSLTREVMSAGVHVSFSVFTVLSHGMHVSLTQFVGGELETRQWFFGAEMCLESIFSEIAQYRRSDTEWYVFTPRAIERCGLGWDHPARNLDRAHILALSPEARVIHIDYLERFARGVMVRRLGVDVRLWAERVYGEGVPDVSGEAEDCLTLAVRADSAMILKLMVMPVCALCA
ncbi:MAG: hypothetical protein IJ165_09575 [Proteobacteria bacterium]|nr:hypothetical protein [Pseudomonadota bacterium]